MMDPLIQRQEEGDEEEISCGREPGMLEMQNLRNDKDQDDSEDDEAVPPPLASILVQCKFWWRVLRFPCLVAAINAIMFLCLVWSYWIETQEFVSLLRGYRYSRFDQNDGKFEIGELSLTMVVLAVLLLVDSFLLWKSALIVKQQLQRLEQQEGVVVSAPYVYSESTNVHARVSKMVDIILAGSKPMNPKVPFLLNFSYMAMSLFLTAGLMAAAVALYLKSRTSLVECLEDSQVAANKVTNISGVPSGLQKWVQPSQSWVTPIRSSSQYVHLQGGSIFFSGMNSTESISDDHAKKATVKSLLIQVSGNGTLLQHTDVVEPVWFGVFQGNDSSKGSPSIFCCMHKTQADWRREQVESSYLDGLGANTMVYCYDDLKGEGHSVEALSTVVEGNHFQGIRRAREYEQKYWFVTDWYKSTGDPGKKIIRVYNMDVVTLEVQLSAQAEVPNEWARRVDLIRDNICLKRLFLWLSVIGCSCLGISSLVLLKWTQVPSGIIPLLVAVYSGLASHGNKLAFYLSLLVAIVMAGCLFGRSLLPRGTTRREVTIWALYGVLICALIQSFMLSVSFGFKYFNPLKPILVGGVWIGISLLLNHSVLRLMGWVGGLTTLVLVCVAFLEKGSVLRVILFGIFYSAGLGSLGYSAAKYRLYLVWYCRRMYRLMDHNE